MSRRDDLAPVWAEEAEQAVIAAMLLEGAAIPKARAVVQAGDFYLNGHGLLFRAIVDVASRGDEVDPLTLADELQRTGHLEAAGGKDYLGFLVDAVPTAANVDYHAAIVARYAGRRRFLALAERAAEQVRRGTADPETAARALSADLVPFAVSREAGKGFVEVTPAEWTRVIEQVLERGERRRRGERVGIPFGFRDYDAVVGGHQPGEFVILGGGPKVGKTAVTLNVTRHAVTGGETVGYVSAEMMRDECLEMLLAACADIPAHKLAHGFLSHGDTQRAGAKAAEFATAGRLFVDDVAFPELGSVLASVQALKVANPALSLVVVDYLQLVSKRMEGRRGDEELGEVCKGLKAVAKRCDVVLVAPAQLNYKDTDKRTDGKPRLHDYQGGSGFAQTANFPLLLWRPALHNPSADEREVRIICERSRRTAPFDVRLRWEGEYRRVTDWREESPIAPADTYDFRMAGD